MVDHYDKDFIDLVEELAQAKKTGNQPTLILGAYAGSLYRSPYLLYEYILKNSINPADFTSQQRFKQAYLLLNRDGLNDHDIHEIIKDSFRGLEPEEADNCLAELVKNNYFHEIISTNVDLLIEESLENVKLFEKRDFEVFFRQERRVRSQAIFNEMLAPGKRERDYRLIKVFGDHNAREYTIRKRFAFFEKRSELKNALQKMLLNNLLIIGLHPEWDEEFFRLIPREGEKLWFISEENYADHSVFQHLAKGREVQYIMKGYWKYYNIVMALYRQLAPDIFTSIFSDNNVEARHSVSASEPMTATKDIPPIPTRLYFSYADDAKNQASHLQTCLKQLRTRGLIDEWHRDMINPGEDKHAQRTTYLSNARIVLLGISPASLEWDTTRQEASQAMQRHQAGEVIVVPILLTPTFGWEHEPFGTLEPLPKGKKAFSTYSKNKREEILSQISSEIENIVKRIRC